MSLCLKRRARIMNKTVICDPAFGRLVKAEHPSGLKIFIMEKPEFSSAHAVFGTRYGSIDTCFSTDGENFVTVPEGIAHFLEHKLFESEEGDAFSRFAKTGAYCNAYTSFDRTCYLFNCSGSFYENLEILLDFVQSPYFTAETVKKEQGIIGQEIKMYEDSPNWRVLFNMLGAMYEKHPVKIDIAGTVESIAKIDDKLLFDCYNTFYNLSNMCLAIAGAVDAEKTLRVIEENLKPSTPVTIYRKNEEEPKGVLKHYTEQQLAVASKLFCFGFKEDFDTPNRSRKERLVANLLIEILAGDSSALYKTLTEKELINDEFEGEYFFGPDYSVIFFSGESGDPEAVSKMITDEAARLLEEGIDEELFEAVKKSYYGDTVREFESLDGVVSNMLEAAFYNEDIFATELIKSITKQDIEERLKNLKADSAVLSVVRGKE